MYKDNITESLARRALSNAIYSMLEAYSEATDIEYESYDEVRNLIATYFTQSDPGKPRLPKDVINNGDDLIADIDEMWEHLDIVFSVFTVMATFSGVYRDASAYHFAAINGDEIANEWADIAANLPNNISFHMTNMLDGSYSDMTDNNADTIRLSMMQDVLKDIRAHGNIPQAEVTRICPNYLYKIKVSAYNHETGDLEVVDVRYIINTRMAVTMSIGFNTLYDAIIHDLTESGYYTPKMESQIDWSLRYVRYMNDQCTPLQNFIESFEYDFDYQFSHAFGDNGLDIPYDFDDDDDDDSSPIYCDQLVYNAIACNSCMHRDECEMFINDLTDGYGEVMSTEVGDSGIVLTCPDNITPPVDINVYRTMADDLDDPYDGCDRSAATPSCVDCPNKDNCSDYYFLRLMADYFEGCAGCDKTLDCKFYQYKKVAAELLEKEKLNEN